MLNTILPLSPGDRSFGFRTSAFWAQIVAKLLAPGGWLYLAEGHPSTLSLDEVDGRLVAVQPWRTPTNAPFVYDNATTYTGVAEGLGLRIAPESVAIYNNQGFFGGGLDPKSPGLFQLTPGAGVESDTLAYWRHEFRTCKEEHRKRDERRSADGEWHVDGGKRASPVRSLGLHSRGCPLTAEAIV